MNLVKKKYRTFEVEIQHDGELLTAVLEWEDTSFAHEFGTQRQGQWNVVYVERMSDGVEVTGTMSDKDFEKLTDLANEQVESEY